MVRHHLRLLRGALLLADGLAAAALFVAVSILRFGPAWQEAWVRAGAPWYVWAAGYGVMWMGAEWLQRLNHLRARWTFRGEISDILRAVFVAAVTVFSVLFLVHAPEVSRFFLVILFAAQIGFSVLQRGLLRLWLAVARSRGIGSRNAVVLGTGPEAVRVAARLHAHPELGYRVLGFLGRPSKACPVVLGPLDDIDAVLHRHVVDEVVAAFEQDEVRYFEPIAALCAQEGKGFRVVVRPGLGTVTGGRVESFDGREFLTLVTGPDAMLGMWLKRAVDLLAAGLALIVLAPVFLVAALAIKLEDRGPVFFRQARVGRHGRTFRIVKFRSMVTDAEAQLAVLSQRNELSGPVFKIDDDPRVTRVGRILRKTSLDEMPQFWNVLRGQMSIVGPRPPLPSEVQDYDLWHRRRLSMKPGITGLWQVSARGEPDFDRWVELDLRYIDRWSLWLDFKIMIRTVPAMLSGR